MRTLQEVNAAMPRIRVKNKDYAQVHAKVMGFRELYPEGRIVTVRLSDDGTRCDFRAEVYDGERLLATGHAYEERTGGGPVNKTSYVENCETSAVGRALAFLGIGSDTGIASAEEVMGAISRQRAIEELDGAKQVLWAACKRWAAQNGANPREHWDRVLAGMLEETPGEYRRLAAEVEAEVV